MLEFVAGRDILKIPIQKDSFTGKEIIYDIYTPNLPKSDSKKLIILIHGMTIAGKDDEDLVFLAKRLAKLGFEVFVPEIRGLKNCQIGYEETNEIKVAIDTAIHLYPDHKTGVMSFCYGNGVLLPVFDDEKIAKNIDFLIIWGGYASMKDLLRFNLLGYYPVDGKLIYSEPDIEVKNKYINQKYWYNFLPQQSRKEWLNALKTNKTGNLTGAQKNTYQFLKNTKLNKFEEYYNKLSPEIQNWLKIISPENYIVKVNCKIIFVHSLRDTLVPYQDALKLYGFANKQNNKPFILPIFEHANLELVKIGIVDVIRGFFIFYMFILTLVFI